MADDPLAAFQQQYQQRLAQLQSGYASAVQNSNVHSWGGSSADAQHWQRVAKDYQNQIQDLQNNFSNLSTQIGQYGLSTDPQAQSLLTQYLQGNGTALQKLNDYVTLQAEAQSQQKQYQLLTQQQQAARQAAQTDLLARIPQYVDTLNQNLVNTEQKAMEQMRPQIDQRLNALGLLQSGALPQAYAQAQTGLDIARENQLNQFQSNAMNQVGLGIPLQGLASDLSNQQASTLGNIEANQGAVQRNFSIQDIYNQQQYQQQLQQQALYAARQNAGFNANKGLQNTLISGGLGIGGALVGGPAGAMIGSGVGNMFGNMFNNPNQPQQYYGTGNPSNQQLQGLGGSSTGMIPFNPYG